MTSTVAHRTAQDPAQRLQTFLRAIQRVSESSIQQNMFKGKVRTFAPKVFLQSGYALLVRSSSPVFIHTRPKITYDARDIF